MKRILILLLGIVLSATMNNALNAVEYPSSVQQTTNDGWEQIGVVALYVPSSYYNEKLRESFTYAKYVGDGTLYLKNVQGFRTFKIVYKGVSYFPQPSDQGFLSGGPNGDNPARFSYRVGNKYICNL